MTVAKKLATYISQRFSFEEKLVEPEACYGKPREMTGFLATLTPEQRKKAIAYRGPEDFGDNDYARANA